MSDSASCCFPKTLKSGTAPTVTPRKFFVAKDDAENIWNALNVSPTDVQAIVGILARRTLDQRLNIINEYSSLHAANLVQDLEKKLSGDVKKVVVAMMTALNVYYASELKYATAGLGTDENILIEVLCTLDNAEIKSIKSAYHDKYSVDLEDDIVDDTSGQFKELLVSLCKSERNELTIPDQVAALSDAEALNNSTGDGRWTVFSDVLVHRSYVQLRLIFTEYKSLTGSDIETAISNHFSGDVKNGLLAIVAFVKNPAGYFAKQLNKSVVGLGTNDRDLVRVVVTRSEVDMADIKQEYEAQFQETLAAAIIGDTSGDYQKCLLLLIGVEP